LPPGARLNLKSEVETTIQNDPPEPLNPALHIAASSHAKMTLRHEGIWGAGWLNRNSDLVSD
jgi:hypothetical protein